ncbi:hypothetical protein M405DRAFT_835822 [Rhizopogon salebrosus TDB-379]|nr:hypothetical protein M405DRAFT_835822 [Rhizopogon salebrosus TDB-379]
MNVKYVGILGLVVSFHLSLTRPHLMHKASAVPAPHQESPESLFHQGASSPRRSIFSLAIFETLTQAVAKRKAWRVEVVERDENEDEARHLHLEGE